MTPLDGWCDQGFWWDDLGASVISFADLECVIVEDFVRMMGSILNGVVLLLCPFKLREGNQKIGEINWMVDKQIRRI